jgi:SAM-dependent methyltransferase
MDNQSKTYKYWNKWQQENQSLVGVYPIGGGGEFEIYYRHFFEAKRLKDKIQFTSDQVVLELGCGNGRWAFELAPLVNYYVGIDINHAAIQYCKERSDKSLLHNLNFYENSIEAFEWTCEKKIDVLYFSGVSQYLTDGDLNIILTKYQKHLSDNCVVIDRSSLHLEKRLIRDDKDYYSIYRTPDEIVALFENYNLKVADSFQSYVFLRNAFWVTNKVIKKVALLCVPFSFYFFLAVANITNLITGRKLDRYVEPYDGKNFAHKFFVFKNSQPEIQGRKTA